MSQIEGEGREWKAKSQNHEGKRNLLERITGLRLLGFGEFARVGELFNERFLLVSHTGVIGTGSLWLGVSLSLRRWRRSVGIAYTALDVLSSEGGVDIGDVFREPVDAGDDFWAGQLGVAAGSEHREREERFGVHG